MRVANSFQLGAGTGAVGKLQRPVEFPDGQRCTRIIHDAIVPIKNTSGAPITITKAIALDIMQKVWGSTSHAFGTASVETIDDAMAFDDLRAMCQALTGRDVLFNGVELFKVAAGNGEVTIAAGATVSVSMALIRPFIVERAGGSLDSWCPYASQMRGLALGIVRGGVFATANLIQDGAADITVRFNVIDSAKDGWAPVPRMFVNNDGGLEHQGPAGGGALLGLWLANSAGAATALSLFSLYRRGDAPLHEQSPAATVVAQSELKEPIGAPSLNDLVTLLFQTEAHIDAEKIATSQAFRLVQHKLDLSPMQSRWLFIPTPDEKYSDQVAAPNLTAGGPVKLVPAPAAQGKDVPGHVSAVSALEAIRPSSEKFATLPGRMTIPGRPPMNHIPETAVQAIAGVSAAGGAERAAREVSALAKFFPGGRSTNRNAGITNTALSLGSTVLQGIGNIGDAAMGILNGKRS